MEFPLFFRPQWQSLRTAITAGNCLPLGLCKGDCERVYPLAVKAGWRLSEGPDSQAWPMLTTPWQGDLTVKATILCQHQPLKISLTCSEFNLLINTYIYIKWWNIIPYPNFDCGLAKPPWRLGHGWAITTHAPQYIPALILGLRPAQWEMSL